MEKNIISNERRDELLAASPSPDRLTPDYLKSRITGTDFTRLTDTLTVCVITMQNGFTVTGESACAAVENYNQELGEKISFENAFDKLWPLEGYLLREKMSLRDA